MSRHFIFRLALSVAVVQAGAALEGGLEAQAQVRDSVRLDFEDTDIRAVIAALAELMGANVTYGKLPTRTVTLKTHRPVPSDSLPSIFTGLLSSNGLTVEEASGVLRIAELPAQQETERGAAEQVQVGEIRLFVIRLKHAHAIEAASTLNALLGAGPSGPGVGPRLSSVGLSAGLRENLVPPGLPQDVAGRPQESSPATVEREEAQFEAEVTIVADVSTNSLLVRATEHDFEIIQSAVELVDVRPRQVMIEVLVLEARSDALTKIGMEIFATNKPSGDKTQISGTLSEPILGNLAVEIMHVNELKVDALFEALATSSDVKILSRPVLVTANNHEAHILVGSERPFIQVSRALPTDAGVRDQIVQYRDVGTKLTLIPTINDDGYVSLVLRQEVSAATSELQFGAPVISTREASTRLLVANGQTVVIGGLIDRQQERIRSGVPLLKDVPIIGALFGSSSWRTVETELFLFMTPHVLETDEDIDRARENVEQAAPRIREQVPPPLVAPDTARADTTAAPPGGEWDSEPQRDRDRVPHGQC